MAEIKRLVRIDFNNLENHSPLSESVVACFVDDADKTAHAYACDFFCTMAPVRLYLGYDSNVYPKFMLVAEPIWKKPEP